MDMVDIKNLEPSGGRVNGAVHVTNYYRLALQSAVNFGKEFISASGESGTTLQALVARGHRALRPDKVEYVDNSILIAIADDIYHSIAYTLEGRQVRKVGVTIKLEDLEEEEYKTVCNRPEGV